MATRHGSGLQPRRACCGNYRRRLQSFPSRRCIYSPHSHRHRENCNPLNTRSTLNRAGGKHYSQVFISCFPYPKAYQQISQVNPIKLPEHPRPERIVLAANSAGRRVYGCSQASRSAAYSSQHCQRQQCRRQADDHMHLLLRRRTLSQYPDVHKDKPTIYMPLSAAIQCTCHRVRPTRFSGVVFP